jgi:hypothetical protein
MFRLDSTHGQKTKRSEDFCMLMFSRQEKTKTNDQEQSKSINSDCSCGRVFAVVSWSENIRINGEFFRREGCWWSGRWFAESHLCFCVAWQDNQVETQTGTLEMSLDGKVQNVRSHVQCPTWLQIQQTILHENHCIFDSISLYFPISLLFFQYRRPGT